MKRVILVLFACGLLVGCTLGTSNTVIITENYHQAHQILENEVKDFLQPLPREQKLVMFFGEEVLLTSVDQFLRQEMSELKNKKMTAIELVNEVFPLINEHKVNKTLEEFVLITHSDEWGDWGRINDSISIQQGTGYHVMYTLDQGIKQITQGTITLKDGQLRHNDLPVLGVVLNAPESTVMDIYPMVKQGLDEQLRVLVIEVDGLGYLMQDVLTAPWQLHPTLSTFPSISNVALAAMLTGKGPDETGIKSRNDRLIEVDTIFELVDDSIYIEGDMALVSTRIEVQLHIDRNGNGTDDEVFEAAKKAVMTDASLIFVHFHGVDDVSHDYGPRHAFTVKKWEEIREYILKLQSMFEGRIILVSDHGLYQVEEEGTHGLFHAESMYALIGIIQYGK